MRKGTCLLVLCVLLCGVLSLSFAGCEGKPSGAPSGTSSETSPQDLLSNPSVSEPSAAGKPAVSDPADESSIGNESSIGDGITLPPEETLAVCDGLCFRLPEGWRSDPASAPETLFFASAADGSGSASAAYTALDTAQGLTEALLIEEFRGSLSSAWTDAGAADVNAATVAVSLLGQPHEALSLTASMNGKAVCQLQVYLLRNDGLYTLTVTAGNAEGAKALLAAFEANA